MIVLAGGGKRAGEWWGFERGGGLCRVWGRMNCSHLLKHDTLGVGCAGERLLPLVTQVGLLVVLVRPQLLATVCA